MYKKTITLALTFLITACQSNRSENSEIAISAPGFNQQNVEALIAQTNKVDLSENDFQGNIQYLDQVYYSVAKQMAELAIKPRHFALPVTLTTKMYNGDAGGFFVLLDSRWLIEQGAIPNNADLAIFSTNNLWNSDRSKSVDRGEYNRLILNGVAVAAIESASSPKQTQLINVSKLFSNDKEANLDEINEILTNHSVHTDHFDYRDYYGSTQTRTRKSVFFIKAEPEQAQKLIGQQYNIVFMAGTAFEIKRTGQLVVIALQQHSMLTDPNNQPLVPSMFKANPLYIWTGGDFDKDFTLKRTKSFIYEDNGSARY